MEKLLKLSFTLALSIHCLTLIAQNVDYRVNCEYYDQPQTGSLIVESKNGYHLPVNGTLRVLVIFIEVNYDIGTDPYPPGGFNPWPAGQLPVWKDQFFDSFVSTNPVGLLTKYFHEASFGNYNLIGDYLINITNPNAPFLINKSSGIGTVSVLDVVNSNQIFQTANSLNQSDFDNWTISEWAAKPFY
jgi:hypothetical protein